MGAFLEYFGSLVSVAALVVLLTNWTISFIQTLTKKEMNSTWKQVISWTLSAIICVIGFIMAYGLFGFYATLAVWQGWILTAVTAILVGFGANKMYDTAVLQKILDAFVVIIQFIASLFNKQEVKK